MAHMKQQIKRYKNDYKKHAKNVAFKSALKTEIKKVLAAVEAGNKEEAIKAEKSWNCIESAKLSRIVMHSDGSSCNEK